MSEETDEIQRELKSYIERLDRGHMPPGYAQEGGEYRSAFRAGLDKAMRVVEIASLPGPEEEISDLDPRARIREALYTMPYGGDIRTGIDPESVTLEWLAPIIEQLHENIVKFAAEDSDRRRRIDRYRRIFYELGEAIGENRDLDIRIRVLQDRDRELDEALDRAKRMAEREYGESFSDVRGDPNVPHLGNIDDDLTPVRCAVMVPAPIGGYDERRCWKHNGHLDAHEAHFPSGTVQAAGQCHETIEDEHKTLRCTKPLGHTGDHEAPVLP